MRLREKPCETCGWKYPGFHVCVDLSKPSEAEQRIRQRKGAQTEDHLQRLQDGRAERWQQYHQENSARYDAMAEMYKKGRSMRDIAKEFNTSHQTINRILREKEAQGLLTIRPRGANLRWSRRSDI